MVKAATNLNTSSNTPARRRGGVNQAAKRANQLAQQQYKYGNKTLNRSVIAGTTVAVAGQHPHHVNTAGADKQSSQVYTRKWLDEADKEKVPFSDETLSTTFGTENLLKLIAACKTATETEVTESNRLLNDDYVYSVQITSHRAPHIPMHLSRISLPHTLETSDSDICVFVKDLKRGRKLDHEPTVKHYEQLLRAKKVDRNITVIPINQLYNEYATFELRRKLTYLYDRFLVDKSVAAHVNSFLGHKLLCKGRSAMPVDLGADNLADEIDAALRKVYYKHINNGITQNVQVGRHSMSDAQIAGNIAELVAQLAIIHPGGTKNVYKLHLKPNVNVSVTVPLYVDLAKPTLETPTATGPREKAAGAAAETAAATLDGVDISKAGDVVAKPKAANAGADDSNIADESQDDGDDVDLDNSQVVAAVAVKAASTPVAAPAPKPRQPAKTAAAKKAVVPAAVALPIVEDQINDLILKNLKKLVPKLAAGNIQQQQQKGGRVQKNQGGGVQQLQQQQQQPQQQLQKQVRQQNNNNNNQQQQQQQLQQQQQQQLLLQQQQLLLQQQQQQLPLPQRQQNNQQQRQQNNNQQGGGYIQQNNQQQVPQQQRQNNNMGNNRRNNNNNNNNQGGGNVGGFQNNQGGGGGYSNQRSGNVGGNLPNSGLGGGLNNYNNSNQRAMGAVGGNRGFNGNAGGSGIGGGNFGNNLGGGNWGNAGGNNDPWAQRNQF